jgi:hypothetical protein
MKLADGRRLRHTVPAMDLMNQRFLLASCFWGAIASGYMVYGWRQQAAIPFVGGAVMMAASCFLPALLMSLVCLAAMFGVYWLLKQGY